MLRREEGQVNIQHFLNMLPAEMEILRNASARLLNNRCWLVEIANR